MITDKNRRIEELQTLFELRLFAALGQAIQKDSDDLGREIIEAATGRVATRFAATMAIIGDISRQDFLTGCKHDFDSMAELDKTMVRRQ